MRLVQFQFTTNFMVKIIVNYNDKKFQYFIILTILQFLHVKGKCNAIMQGKSTTFIIWLDVD